MKNENEEIDPEAEVRRALEPVKPGEWIPERLPNGEFRIRGAIYPGEGEKGPLDEYPDEPKNFTYYIRIKLDSAAKFFRYYGGNARLEGRGPGTYYSFFPPGGTREFMRQQMSLDTAWGNTMQRGRPITIPAGTTVYIGPAAPQPGYTGGGIQVFVPKMF